MHCEVISFLGLVLISHHELQSLPVFKAWGMLLFGNTGLGFAQISTRIDDQTAGEFANGKAAVGK
jgi:hypothetical protein